MRRTSIPAGLLLAAFVLLLATPAWGQEDEPSESVRGTLIDRKGTRDRSDDEPVADAQVTVAEQGGDDVDTV